MEQWTPNGLLFNEQWTPGLLFNEQWTPGLLFNDPRAMDPRATV